jgi:hypothetical protein
VIEQLKVLPQLFLALFFRGQAALVYSAISFTDVLAASLIVCATVAYARRTAIHSAPLNETRERTTHALSSSVESQISTTLPVVLG